MIFQKLKDELELLKNYFKYEDYEEIKRLIVKTEIEHSDKCISEDSNAEELKKHGNEAFGNGDYELSVDYYTKAISIIPNSTYYSNRAAAYVKLGKIENAISDCEKAIDLDSNFLRPYLRLGLIYFDLDKNKSEIYFSKALELDPENELCKIKLEELKKNKNSSVPNISEILNNPGLMGMARDILKDKSPEDLKQMLDLFLQKK